MDDDREIARRALDFQARARDYRLMDIPGYRKWSQRKLNEGESPALIAHLDSTGMFMLPEEIATVSEETFDELLEDLKSEFDEGA